MTDDSTELAIEQFTGNPDQRMVQAAATAEHLERVLALIKDASVTATATEVARIEGAVLALRMICRA